MADEVDPHTITPQNNSHLSEGLLGIADRVRPASVGPGHLLVDWSVLLEDYLAKVIELGTNQTKHMICIEALSRLKQSYSIPHSNAVLGIDSGGTNSDPTYLLEYNSILEVASPSQMNIIFEHHVQMAGDLEGELALLHSNVLTSINAVNDQSHKAMLENEFEQMQTLAQKQIGLYKANAAPPTFNTDTYRVLLEQLGCPIVGDPSHTTDVPEQEPTRTTLPMRHTVSRPFETTFPKKGKICPSSVQRLMQPCTKRKRTRIRRLWNKKRFSGKLKRSIHTKRYKNYLTHDRYKHKGLQPPSDNIVNVSNKILTPAEIKLLNKGLSFVPKPFVIKKDHILTDFNQLARKMRLRYIFHGSSNEKSRFKRKSGYNPGKTDNATLELAIDTLRNKISDLDFEQTQGTNLTISERKALKELMNDNSIVINKADKGSTIVVQNHKDYALEGLKHLSDASVYMRLPLDTTPFVDIKVNKFIDKLYEEGHINKDMANFCRPPRTVRTARLYFLLKVHKNPMGIRPIVSCVNNATENMSQFVDIWLQPLMKALPSYIRDTTHFINIIEATAIPAGCLICSIDVSSLYTNIIHEEGIQQAIQALHSTYNVDPDQPPPEIVGEMLKFILTNNVFEFEGQPYLQLQGCAMGSKCSPSYACLFMGNLELQLQSMGGNKILLWLRYIDDIFLIWNGSQTEFNLYLEEINKIHRTIKFTAECSDKEINFLDTTLYKGSRFTQTGVLDIKTHVKPTNKQLYVHATSYHPSGCRKGIVIGEANRYLRTNSDELEFVNSLGKHKSKLTTRGYKPRTVSKLLQSISFEQRKQKLLVNSKSNDEDVLTFVTTYNDCTSQLRQTVYECWPLLHRDNILLQLFPKPPIMSLRKNPSLSNKLVKSKPDPLPELLSEHSNPIIEPPPMNIIDAQEAKISKCGRRTCRLCPMLITDTSVRSKLNKRKHRIYGEFTCQTTNLVYMLECKKCGKQYIGQTVLSFAHRVAKHLLTINGKGSDKLALHFNNDGHGIHHISFQPIAKLPNGIGKRETEKQLQELESAWIKRLGTLQPVGLNFVLQDKQTRVTRA